MHYGTHEDFSVFCTEDSNWTEIVSIDGETWCGSCGEDDPIIRLAHNVGIQSVKYMHGWAI